MATLKYLFEIAFRGDSEFSRMSARSTCKHESSLINQLLDVIIGDVAMVGELIRVAADAWGEELRKEYAKESYNRFLDQAELTDNCTSSRM